MRRVSQKEIENVLRLEGARRFRRFVKSVAGAEEAWALWSDGWTLLADPTGQKVFPLWPEKEYAELCRLDDWSNHEARAIPLQDLLDDLLPRLDREGIFLGVFPRPSGDDTSTCDGATLAEALQLELEDYA